jgi:hypothetical protein
MVMCEMVCINDIQKSLSISIDHDEANLHSPPYSASLETDGRRSAFTEHGWRDFEGRAVAGA